MGYGRWGGLAGVKIRYLLQFVCFLALSLVLACGGVGGTSTSVGNPGADDPGGEGGGPTELESLFGEGPVDLPVTIAKLEAPDATKISYSVTAGTVTITGEAGAMPDVAGCEFVYIFNSSTLTVVTATVNPDLGFAATDIAGSEGQSIAVACFDGDSTIGLPIIINIEGSNGEDSYIWLTNSNVLHSTATTASNGRVYMVTDVLDSDAATDLSLIKAASDTSSTVYTLDVGGTYDKLVEHSAAIHEIFATDEATIVRSSNTYYIVEDGALTELMVVDAAETIQQAAINPSGGSYFAVLTDAGFYVVDISSVTNSSLVKAGASSSGFTLYTVVTFAANESIGSFDWFSSGGMDVVFVTEQTEDEPLITDYSVIATDAGSWENSWANKSLTNNVDDGKVAAETATNESSVITLEKIALTVGDKSATGQWDNYKPQTLNAFNSANPDPAVGLTVSTVNVFAISGSVAGGRYMLNAAITQQEGTGGRTITAVTTTRTIYDVELHPNGKMVVMCIEDENELGQLFVYSQLSEGTFLQLTGNTENTSNVEHCNEDKNWKIDQETGNITYLNAFDTSSAADINATQVNFIDPTKHPGILELLGE